MGSRSKCCRKEKVSGGSGASKPCELEKATGGAGLYLAGQLARAMIQSINTNVTVADTGRKWNRGPEGKGLYTVVLVVWWLQKNQRT